MWVRSRSHKRGQMSFEQTHWYKCKQMLAIIHLHVLIMWLSRCVWSGGSRKSVQGTLLTYSNSAVSSHLFPRCFICYCYHTSNAVGVMRRKTAWGIIWVPWSSNDGRHWLFRGLYTCFYFACMFCLLVYVEVSKSSTIHCCSPLGGTHGLVQQNRGNYRSGFGSTCQGAGFETKWPYSCG
jgi:hypothetical protein